MPGLVSFLSDAPEGQQPALFSLARQLMSGAGRAALIKMYGADCAEDEAEAESSVAQLLATVPTRETDRRERSTNEIQRSRHDLGRRIAFASSESLAYILTYKITM